MNQIFDFFTNLFASSDWPPRWHCGKWTEFHGWLYIMSDLLIWSAYFTIPIVIIRYISRKKNIRFTKLYFLFAAFILACGATHFLDALAFWIPVYRLSALVRFITGVVSWLTVFYLVKYLPVFFSLRSPSALEAEIEERKQTELALKKSRKDYELLADGVKDHAVFMLDTEGRVASWNSGAENIKGYTATEITGQSIAVFYTAEQLQQGEPERNLQQALIHGKFETTGWRVRKDGSLFWADVVFTTLYDEHNQFYGYAKITRDISEKRRAEEHILFLASIASNIQDPVISTDNDGVITRWNKAAESLLGWHTDEVIGKRGTDILKIDYLGTTRASILESLKQKNYWHGEVVYHARSGKPVNVLITASQLKDSEGNVTGNLAVVRDITERKIAEAKIKQSEILYSTLFYQSPGMKAISEAATGKYLDINDSFARFLERPKTEIVGKTSLELDMITHAAERERSMKQIQQFGFVRDVEMSVMSASGKKYWVSINADSITIDGKKCFLSDAVDITKRKEAEDAIRKLNEELEQKVAERTAALQKSEAQYRHLFSNNPMPMFVMEQDTFKFRDVNDAALLQYGYSRDEFFSLTALDICLEEDHANFLQSDLSNVSNRKNYNKEIWKHLKKDGTVMQVEIVAHEILFGGIKARLVLARDVTEEKKMQELLLEHEEQFELFSKHSPVALAMLDKDMIYLAASDRWVSDFGLEEKNLVGLSHYNLFPEIPAYWKEIHRRCLDGAVEKNDEDLFIRHDGSSSWLRWEVHPWHKASGEVGGMIIFSEDITERKLAETKLAASEMRFRALIENNHGIISLTDDSLKLIYRTPSSTRITGWTEEDLKKNGGINYFHPDDVATVANAVAEAINKPGVPQQYLARYLHKHGHYIWLEGIATKMPADSIIKGLVFNVRDVTERMELEQLLNKANALARIGGWEIDLVKGSVYWSDITREIHETGDDYVPDLSTGISFYKEGRGRDLINKKVKEAIELGKPWDVELQIITAKNNERWIRSIGETEFKEGKCVRIYGSFQDITERKKGEIERERLSERLQLATQSAQLGLWDWDVKNNELVWDEGMYRLYNIGENEFTSVYEGWASRVHADDRQRVDHEIQLALAGKKDYEPEFRIVWKDASVHYIKASGIIEKDKEGNLVRMTGFNWDITEQKKAEQAIQASEEKFRQTFERISDGFVAVDKNWRYTYMNKRAAEITRQDPRLIIGKHLWEQFPDLIGSTFYKAYQQALKEQQYVYLEEYYPIYDQWFENHIYPSPDGLSVYFTDITERKKAEQKISNLNIELEQKVTIRTEQLRKTIEELEAFSYSVSHDLRAPLRSIIGFTSILEEDYSAQLDDEAMRITGIIKNDTLKMGILIDDLLSFSRLGRQQIVKVSLHTDEMVKKVIEELELKNSSREVNWKIEPLPIIMADPSTIRQVWVNLLSNAVKYSHKQQQPVIEIGTIPGINETIFFVKDNGVGFNEQFSDKLFKVFQRLHSDADFEGTGVGLAIVERIISKHGGKVWAKGETGKGASFFFSLPNELSDQIH